jgi:DNA-binding transcriptional MerR regulator/methylmalonyl-CoA mutase cobalamin-binding subunit
MPPSYSIGTVSIETGINKETLRKWETRYGFPIPARSSDGRRAYPAEQVAQLTELKRLIDSGMRPSQAMQDPTHRARIDPAKQAKTVLPTNRSELVTRAIAALRSRQLPEFRALLERDLTSRGLRAFIEETVTELNWAVGEAWSSNDIRVFEEHIYSAILSDLLAQRTRCLDMASGHPRVLLTTLPGELHTLGLDMVKACFMEAGAYCLNLGAQTPLTEVAAAAQAYDIGVVALSISACYPQRQVTGILCQLRALLPSTCQLWVGGAGACHVSQALDGIRIFASIGMALTAINELQHPIAPTDVQH